MTTIDTADSKHWLWPRYHAMHSRCYNPNYKDYQFYGAKGIQVSRIWHKSNPIGFSNFVEWVENALAEAGIETPHFFLCRRRSGVNFNPDNCVVSEKPVTIMQHRFRKLDEKDVVEAREQYRQNPKLVIRDMAIRLGVSDTTLSFAIHGRTWRYLNTICPPVGLSM